MFLRFHIKKWGLLLIALLSFSFSSSFGQNFVTIRAQVWMSENLKTDTFRNGDLILHAQSSEEWINAGKNKQPAWCYYQSYVSDCLVTDEDKRKYGKLYNWYAFKDARGLAPVGWHIPSKEEWVKLVDYLGDSKKAAIKMRLAKEWSWSDKGTNSSGFNALPGGYRNDYYFIGFKILSAWWCSNEEGTDLKYPVNASIDYYHRTNHYYFDFGRDGINSHYQYQDGLSVRCIKD